MHINTGKAAKIAAALLLVLSYLVLPAHAEAAAAKDITRHCKFSPSSNAKSFRTAIDGSYKTCWNSSVSGLQYIDITIPAKYGAGGLYFRWGGNKSPEWQLCAVTSGNSTVILEGGGNECLTGYEYIPSGYASCKKFRLQALRPDTKLSIVELSVYTPGNAPYYAPRWQPFTGRADILLIATHPDDEQLYLGPIAPTYIQQGKKVVTAFINNVSPRRHLEAEEAVWSSGERTCPAAGWKVAKYTLDGMTAYIVEQIRKFKPAIVVTHDIKGEYGHFAHKLTVRAAQIAFEKAGDAQYYPESAAKYGVWNAAKLYIHLYNKQQIVLNIKVKLSAYGGKTALQVVQNAYKRHKSQLPGRALPVNGRYDFRKFGLFDSRVGPDKNHKNMFENIKDGTMLVLNPWYTPPQIE